MYEFLCVRNWIKCRDNDSIGEATSGGSIAPRDARELIPPYLGAWPGICAIHCKRTGPDVGSGYVQILSGS